MKKQRLSNIFFTLISIAATLYFIYLGAVHFKSSYMRFFEGAGDLWQSLKFYFCELFGIPHTNIPTVEGYSDVMKWTAFLPEDFEAFKAYASSYFTLLFSKENLLAFGRMLGEKISAFAKIASILLPCIILMWQLVKRIYAGTNTRHNVDTIPLRLFKFFSKITYRPLKILVYSYIAYLKKHRKFVVFWAFLWVFHLNLASIAIAFFAYYFYFTVSFKFDTIYVQFCKLFIDLQVVGRVFPWWILAVLGYILFHRFRKSIAGMKLRYMEARNCGYINELPIVSMTCGSMGKKKTTIITDMALSQEVMFRQKAFSLLQKNDMKFPHFPWILFEMELRACMEHGTVYNLATVKEWVEKKRARFEKHQNTHLQLYGYDLKTYGFYYTDGLRTEDIFDVLTTYGQLYLIYIIESSLIVANYAIRTDNELIDTGNFPMWAMDFFPDITIEGGSYSHILDFDVLRLGKKVIENNPNAGSFEFGVVAISEVGKERGNVLDHKELKKNQDETNQKNDLFNSWLKMCRHSATVDHFPFIKVFTDEQRPESWGADARDLCDIAHIASSSKPKLALPFFTLEEMVCEEMFGWFINLYYGFRHRRGDNTLLVYLLKSITAWLYRINIKVQNRYGYSVAQIEKERGTMDGKIEKKRYFLMNKKIYSRRFSTDCFSDYFNDMARKSRVGLNDYLEYADEKASVEELKKQNSYFINALYKSASSD